MPTKKHTNVVAPLRWSLQSASLEFAVDRKTLIKRLTESEIQPSEQDGLYSTLQIYTAITGVLDIKKERLRKTKEEADHVAFLNAKDRGDYSSHETVFNSLVEVFLMMRQIILSSGVPVDLQYALLSMLRDIPVESISGQPNNAPVP